MWIFSLIAALLILSFTIRLFSVFSRATSLKNTINRFYRFIEYNIYINVNKHEILFIFIYGIVSFIPHESKIQSQYMKRCARIMQYRLRSYVKQDYSGKRETVCYKIKKLKKSRKSVSNH